MPKKGSICQNIEILTLTPGGAALGRGSDENGEFSAYFDARTVAPGDIVSARILGKRNKLIQARVEQIQKPSPQRREPRCQHFGICGGCSLQHIPYAEQLRLKESIVRQCLADFDTEGLWLPTIACANEFYFRNKMEFTASQRAYLADPAATQEPARGALGLFVPYCGNKVLNIETCHLQSSVGDQIRHWLRQRCQELGLNFYHSNTHQGWLRTVLIRNSQKGDFLVLLIVAEDHSDLPIQLCQELKAAFPAIASIGYLINQKLNDSYADLSPILVAGSPTIIETIGQFAYSVGPQTFLQVNSAQTVVLYDRIRQAAQLQGHEIVYDLYCGVGTISLWLAGAAQKVIGIEYVESAVAAARQAAIDNGQNNTNFFAGDMKDLLAADFFDQHGQPDLIVTDPPRAGMHPKALACLAASGAQRIVYVSCNPLSLARDLPVLLANYQLQSIQAVDLMPQSHHIETIAVLELS